LSLIELQEAGFLASGSIRNEVQWLFEDSADKARVAYTLHELFSYLASRKQAASFLISWGYLWDAEIVMRSFYEASVKIWYIGFSPSAERQDLVQEYWDHLEEGHNRKISRKADYAAGLFREADPRSRTAFEYLKATHSEASGPQTNKATRRALEAKWSFSEIVEKLSKEPIALAEVRALLHMYGTSSHLIHADAKALDLILDRATRPNDEHSALASDMPRA
jgi:hypothetical protein